MNMNMRYALWIIVMGSICLIMNMEASAQPNQGSKPSVSGDHSGGDVSKPSQIAVVDDDDFPEDDSGPPVVKTTSHGSTQSGSAVRLDGSDTVASESKETAQQPSKGASVSVDAPGGAVLTPSLPKVPATNGTLAASKVAPAAQHGGTARLLPSSSSIALIPPAPPIQGGLKQQQAVVAAQDAAHENSSGDSATQDSVDEGPSLFTSLMGYWTTAADFVEKAYKSPSRTFKKGIGGLCNLLVSSTPSYFANQLDPWQQRSPAQARVLVAKTILVGAASVAVKNLYFDCREDGIDCYSLSGSNPLVWQTLLTGTLAPVAGSVLGNVLRFTGRQSARGATEEVVETVAKPIVDLATARIEKVVRMGEGRIRDLFDESQARAKVATAKHRTWFELSKHGVQEAKKTVDSSLARVEVLADKVEKGANKIEAAPSKLGWGALGVSAGVLGLAMGAYWLHKYIEKRVNQAALQYTYQKAQMKGSLAGIIRRVIVPPVHRKKLDDFLLENLSVKRAHSPECSLADGDCVDVLGDKQEAFYSNLALLGPHGSGKSMFAEEMAQMAKMDLYKISWDDLRKLKDAEAAHHAIAHFFKEEVPKKSPNGAVVFIDNAQLLFNSAREHGTVSLQAGISEALIAATEEPNNKYVVIFGMNAYPRFDQDILRVVSDAIEIPKAQYQERVKILQSYRDQYFKGPGADKAYELLSDRVLEDIARRLHSASAGKLAQLVGKFKVEHDMPSSGGLTMKFVEDKVHALEVSFQDIDQLNPNAAAPAA